MVPDTFSCSLTRGRGLGLEGQVILPVSVPGRAAVQDSRHSISDGS